MNPNELYHYMTYQPHNLFECEKVNDFSLHQRKSCTLQTKLIVSHTIMVNPPNLKIKIKIKSPKMDLKGLPIQTFHFILVGTNVTKPLPHENFDNNGEKEIHVISLVTLIAQ